MEEYKIIYEPKNHLWQLFDNISESIKIQNESVAPIIFEAKRLQAESGCRIVMYCPDGTPLQTMNPTHCSD